MRLHILILFNLYLWAFATFAQQIPLRPLPGAVNTSRTEYAPSISADGKTMLFESDIEEEGKYKLYSSRLINGEWSKPNAIDAVNNYDEKTLLIGGPAISYDANQIYYFANFENSYGAEDIYFSNRTQDGWSTPINAGKLINSRSYEGFPSISSDGEKLYYIRTKPNRNIFCTKIVVSTKDKNGNWGAPTALPLFINAACEKCPRILSDNETLIFASNRKNKTTSNFDLYMSRLSTDNTWSVPVPITPLNTPEDDQFATISSRGDEVFLINNKTGNYDIYYANLPEEFRPRKVTDIQGTVFSDYKTPLAATIFIYRDGKLKNGGGLNNNASDGQFGYTLTQGYSYQIITRSPGYQSDTVEFDLTTASEYKLIEHDVHMIPGMDKLALTTINALTKDTISVTAEVPDGFKNVLNQGSKGLLTVDVKFGDKFQLTLEHPGFTPATFSFDYNSYGVDLVHIIALKPTLPELLLQAIDKDTKGPLLAVADVFEPGNPKPLLRSRLPATGWKGQLKYDKVYEMRLRMPGYFSVQDTINLVGVFDGRYIEKIVPMIRLKVGNKLSLNNVYFDTGSAELKPASRAVLSEVAYVMKQNRNFVMEIGAHTDDVGGESSNKALSTRRAESVKNYLLSQGILPTVIVTKGYGESAPVVPNDSDENRTMNRRVEFVIVRVL